MYYNNELISSGKKNHGSNLVLTYSLVHKQMKDERMKG